MVASRKNSDIGEVRDLPLSQLSIGKSQARVSPNKDIDDLAMSIRTIGLLEPIVVTPVSGDKYEILTGQRRFLAHVQLEYETIKCVIVERELDQREQLAISVTENLVRKDLSRKELINACTMLYRRYGSMKMVSEETGLSTNTVSEYVKYDQLVEGLKELVDAGKIDVKAALQAQRAATDGAGDVDEDAAVKFGKELAPMGAAQRGNFVKAAEEDPDASIEEKIEKGRAQPVVRQIVVTLEAGIHQQLQTYARDEGLKQDEAAATLLEEALSAAYE